MCATHTDKCLIVANRFDYNRDLQAITVLVRDGGKNRAAKAVQKVQAIFKLVAEIDLERKNCLNDMKSVKKSQNEVLSLVLPGANGFILGETPGEKDARERQASDSEAMTCLNIVLEQLRAADASRLVRVHKCSSECHAVLERHMNK